MASDIKLLDEDQILVEGKLQVNGNIKASDAYIGTCTTTFLRGNFLGRSQLFIKNQSIALDGREDDKGTENIALFHSEQDELVLNERGGYLGGVKVIDRLRVCQKTNDNNTAGIWFYQTKPAKDQAFVGMSSDTQVGFYGSTGAGWGLVMDTSTGNVGIGTPDPRYKLDVAGRMQVREANGTAGIWFYQTKPARNQAFVGMSTDTQVGFWGNTGANWGLVMDTTTGNVGIGTGQATPSQKLHVVGDSLVTGTLTATAVKQTSSRVLKENIAELSPQEAISALTNLNPVKFNFKADSNKESHVGFIAEDVPELVAMADRKTLSSMNIVAVLTKVVQEQHQQISQLVTEVNALKQAQKLRS